MDNSRHPTTLSGIVTSRLTRRGLIAGGAGVGLTAALAACGNSSATSAASGDASSATAQSTSAASAASGAASGTASQSASAAAGVGADSSAGSTAAAATNTKLSAGSYTATFSTTGSGGLGNAAGSGSSSAPSAPAGGASGSGASAGAAPSGAAPSGAAPGGTAPSGAAPSGAAPSGAAPSGAAPGGSGGTTSGGSQTLKGAYLVDGVQATIEGGTWTSKTADQNVFLVVNGGSLTIKDAVIEKSGDTASQDNSNFYGMNAAILVVGAKSSVTITNCKVTTASEGSNALFSTNGATLTASRVTISTTKNSSRGLDATYEGKVNASGMDISTTGQHSACVATDRGNGTVKVTGSNRLNTTGQGSPLIYCTGDIAVAGATGTSTASQTMVIEGKNKITLATSTLTTSGTEGMMIYQSFSGDAADSSATASHSTMTITDSTITSSTAKPMIYVTNTTCVVSATNSKLTHPSGSKLLDLEADQWGTSGSNGGHATVTFDDCGALTGNLTAGSTSTATVKLTGGTTSAGSTSGSVTVSKS